ncbi:MAG TPA: plastocyanin/azurin family copper-binding protein [Gemmatimonadales bacterium]|nr:plastocyanin/azurin family copper-binding protein [Gemmatimonadales bacterium]
MDRLSRALAVLGVTVGLTAAGVAACFSGREATAPVEGVCSLPLGEGVPGSTLVVIRGFAFGPVDVRVRAGERVTWVNCDTDIHTSTADAGQWASQVLAPGDAFTQAFPTIGEFSYHCEPHPFMIGRVIVE